MDTSQSENARVYYPGKGVALYGYENGVVNQEGKTMHREWVAQMTQTCSFEALVTSGIDHHLSKLPTAMCDQKKRLQDSAWGKLRLDVIDCPTHEGTRVERDAYLKGESTTWPCFMKLAATTIFQEEPFDDTDETISEEHMDDIIKTFFLDQTPDDVASIESLYGKNEPVGEPTVQIVPFDVYTDVCDPFDSPLAPIDFPSMYDYIPLDTYVSDTCVEVTTGVEPIGFFPFDVPTVLEDTSVPVILINESARELNDINGRCVEPKRKKTRVRKRRCGKCANCSQSDCGKCKFCLDKKKFGGSDTLRKACLLRTCTFTMELCPLVGETTRGNRGPVQKPRKCFNCNDSCSHHEQDCSTIQKWKSSLKLRPRTATFTLCDFCSLCITCEGPFTKHNKIAHRERFMLECHQCWVERGCPKELEWFQLSSENEEGENEERERTPKRRRTNLPKKTCKE